MSGFSFSLQRLLDVKKIEEQAVIEEMAAIQQELWSSKTKLSKLESRVRFHEARVGTAHTGQTPWHKFCIQFYYIDNLKRRLYAETAVVRSQEAAFAKVRNKFMSVMQERKSLEKLKTREMRHWTKARQRDEQRMADDTAVTRYVRNRQREELSDA